MSVPGIVQSALGDEPVAAQVGLGGEDQLYVTPSRILIYRGEGLLSDEGLEEYAHQAERVDVSEGRRKAKITLKDDLEGDRSFSVGPSRLEDVLHPVLAGVLSTAGVTDAGETVKQTYRFSELTLIITSKRLVKHIGNAVWDTDYEEFRYEDTTDLDFEEGSVATQIVLEVDGRRERIKAPNDKAPAVRAQLEEALFEFYDVSSLEEFRAGVAEAEGEATGSAPDPEETASGNEGIAFESDLSPLRTGTEDEDDGHEAADAFLEEDQQDAGAAPVGDAAGADATGADAAPNAGSEPGDDAAGGTDPLSPGAAATGSSDPGGQAEAAGRTETSGQAEAAGGTDQGASGGGRDHAQPQGDPPEVDRIDEGGVDEAAVEDATAAAAEGRLPEGELERRLDEIARSVNKQNELLKRHQRTMEKLIDELQRMNE